jgi:hypothetical protein
VQRWIPKLIQKTFSMGFKMILGNGDGWNTLTMKTLVRQIFSNMMVIMVSWGLMLMSENYTTKKKSQNSLIDAIHVLSNFIGVLKDQWVLLSTLGMI